MMFLTHLSFALFLGLLIIKNAFIPVDYYTFLAIILLGSLLPDIDCATSLIGRKFKLLNFFFEHRGFFHTIVLMIIITILVFLITKNYYYSLAIILGFSSHLFLDGFTLKGITPFWPSKLRFKGIFKTGRLFDLILFVGFVVLDVFLLL